MYTFLSAVSFFISKKRKIMSHKRNPQCKPPSSLDDFEEHSCLPLDASVVTTWLPPLKSHKK